MSTNNNKQDNVNYEYLQVNATVINMTDNDMIIKGSDLSWGKWMESPVDVKGKSFITFGSQGRGSSPSGTTGWAKWEIENHPDKPVIEVKWDNPLHGHCTSSITCTPKVIPVAVKQSGGNNDIVTFSIG